VAYYFDFANTGSMRQLSVLITILLKCAATWWQLHEVTSGNQLEEKSGRKLTYGGPWNSWISLEGKHWLVDFTAGLACWRCGQLGWLTGGQTARHTNVCHFL